MNGLWQRAGDRMRDQLGQVGYETWIGPLNFVAHQGSTVTVEAPNRFFRDWINDRYLSMMRSALSAEAGGEIEVRLTLGEHAAIAPQQHRPSNAHSNGNGHANGNGNGKAVAANRATTTAAPRGDRHPTLNARYSFAEFVVGSANQFAHAAAQAVANQPGEKYNPLFIYGGVGLGKTHLVTAIGHHIWASGERPRKVLFMPAEIFMNELIGSLRRDKMNEFREKFRRVDTLILDDVQFLAGRERTQEEFFHTFNALHAERHQIILTSDKIPREIPGLEERLRNRFEMGLIADIAQSVSSNVRELEGCLTRLAALASFDGSAITVEFAKNALQDLVRNSDAKPDIDSIQKTVSDFFHIRLADLKSKKRTQHIAFCR